MEGCYRLNPSRSLFGRTARCLKSTQGKRLQRRTINFTVVCCSHDPVSHHLAQRCLGNQIDVDRRRRSKFRPRIVKQAIQVIEAGRAECQFCMTDISPSGTRAGQQREGAFNDFGDYPGGTGFSQKPRPAAWRPRRPLARAWRECATRAAPVPARSGVHSKRRRTGVPGGFSPTRGASATKGATGPTTRDSMGRP